MIKEIEQKITARQSRNTSHLFGRIGVSAFGRIGVWAYRRVGVDVRLLRRHPDTPIQMPFVVAASPRCDLLLIGDAAI
jgi:hypothetical protein